MDGLPSRRQAAVCWAETFGELAPGNVGYYLATAFDEIWLQPSGDVGLTGFTAEAFFLRGALDKLGVESQMGQRHEYKTAADTFLRSRMTEATPRDGHPPRRVGRPSRPRGTSPRDAGSRRKSPRARRGRARVGAEALDRGLVDRLGYRDEVYDETSAVDWARSML